MNTVHRILREADEFLIRDVRMQRLHVRWADGEQPVAVLPIEIQFCPFRALPLAMEFQPFGLCWMEFQLFGLRWMEFQLFGLRGMVELHYAAVFSYERFITEGPTNTTLFAFILGILPLPCVYCE